MKKFLLSALMLTTLNTASAQRFMRIWQGGESTRIALQDITYTDSGARISADGVTYQTSEVDSITIVKEVDVTFSGTTATVDLGNSTDITYEINGAHVTLTNTNTTEEMEVEVTGSSTNGSLTYVGSYKTKIHLNGVNLTSLQGAALDIQNGKRIDLILEDGTTNTLIDGTAGEQKACLYCKGHLEISGSGSLNVTGNTRHAIATKEYFILKKSTGNITIAKAAGDAIHAGQYFQMNGGTLNISGMAGDGIQAEITDDPTEEMNGQVISSGTDMIINEDDNTTQITIKATGSKYTDPVTKESSKCMGIRVVEDLTITAGTINISKTYSSSKGIKVGGTYYAKGGNVSADVDATATVK